MGNTARFILILLSLLLLIYFLTSLPPKTTLALSAGAIILIISFLSTESALYLLIFSMLLSPEIVIAQTPAREVSIRSEDIILSIIIFGWLAKTAVFKELGLFVKTPLNRPILIYSLLCIIATLIGMYAGRVNIYSGFFFTLKYIQYFFIYFMVLNNVREIRQVKRFAIAMLLAGFIISLYALYQIPQGGRVTAPFEGVHGGEPNTLGGYLVLILSITLGLLASLKRRHERLLLAGLAILIVFPLIFTLSRSSWLALIPMSFVFITMSERRMLFLLVFLILALSIPFVVPATVKERAITTFKEAEGFERTARIGRIAFDPSASERILGFRDAIKAWKRKPVLGYGVTGKGFIDGQYFRVLVEVGFLGVVAFLWLIYTVLKSSWLTYNSLKEPFLKGLSFGFIAGTAALLVHAIGANTFIIVRIMEPYWFLAALVLAAPKLIEDSYSKPQVVVN